MNSVQTMVPDIIWIHTQSAQDAILTERGKLNKVLPKIIFFMMVYVLKHSGTWELDLSVFKWKSATFERMLNHFMKVATTYCSKGL